MLLQRPAVREAEFPRLIAQRVHRIQVCRGQLGTLPARKENNAGHGCGNGLPEALERRRGYLVDARLIGALLPGEDHVRLEQGPLEVHTLTVELTVHRPQGAPGHLSAPLDGMAAVHQHLRLDDRHQPGLLT